LKAVWGTEVGWREDEGGLDSGGPGTLTGCDEAQNVGCEMRRDWVRALSGKDKGWRGAEWGGFSCRRGTNVQSLTEMTMGERRC